MKIESPPVSIDLKSAAFKALLQGPVVFTQFSGRFCVSRGDMQEWLDDAWANLGLVDFIEAERTRAERQKCSSPLVCEERDILLGKQ